MDIENYPHLISIVNACTIELALAKPSSGLQGEPLGESLPSRAIKLKDSWNGRNPLSLILIHTQYHFNLRLSRLSIVLPVRFLGDFVEFGG